MRPFKRLGVFLSNSPADASVLAFAVAIVRLEHSDTVRCSYISEAEHAEQPDPTVFAAEVRRQLPEAVARIAQVEVQPRAGVSEILRSARELDFDLVVVGRRMPATESDVGSAFVRLARKAPCSVLVIPQGAAPQFGHVLVAVDFSAHSHRALEHGLALLRQGGAARPALVVFANSPIGYGYSKLGLTLDEAAAERERVVAEQLREFVEGLDTSGVEVELVAATAESTERAVQEAAAARHVDLIVLGSRGTSGVFMLGSIAERVLHGALLPVLIVKEKGETVPILEALFGAG